MCHLLPVGTLTGTMTEHSHYCTIHIPSGWLRWQRGGRGLLVVCCWRGGGGEEYDFTIETARDAYSSYFYMYTCHLPYARICYCQWFPYGLFLKHFTGGSCFPGHCVVKTGQQHLTWLMENHSPPRVLRLFRYHDSFQFQLMVHFPGYSF